MVSVTGFSGLRVEPFCPHPEKQVMRITKHNKIAIFFIVPPSDMGFPTRIPTLLKIYLPFLPFFVFLGRVKKAEILIIIIARLSKEGIDLAFVTKLIKGYPFM